MSHARDAPHLPTQPTDPSVLSCPSPPQDAKRADFPLPTLGPKLAALQHEASFGRGFVVLKGVPVERYSRKASVIAFWLIGQHWGLVSRDHTALSGDYTATPL